MITLECYTQKGWHHHLKMLHPGRMTWSHQNVKARKGFLKWWHHHIRMLFSERVSPNDDIITLECYTWNVLLEILTSSHSYKTVQNEICITSFQTCHHIASQWCSHLTRLSLWWLRVLSTQIHLKKEVHRLLSIHSLSILETTIFHLPAVKDTTKPSPCSSSSYIYYKIYRILVYQLYQQPHTLLLEHQPTRYRLLVIVLWGSRVLIG